MTITKTVVKVIDNQTIALSANEDDTTGSDLSSCISVAIGYEMTFNGSATAGATIKILADPDGASQTFTIGTYHDSTDEYDVEVDIGHKAEGVVQMNHSPIFMKVRVTNNDTAQSITACSVWVIKQTA